MWRPATTRQSVKGVDTINPMGPQSELQKIAAMTTDSGDRPVVWPYNCGSMSWPAINSTMTKSPRVPNASDQPGSTAAASTAANSAAIQMPT